MDASIEQGDSHSEVIICIDTKFKLSIDLTVIERYNDFWIYRTSLS